TRVVFSWDISPSWQVESDRNKTSEVEVQFIAETAQRTRVELEHRNLERHGDGWEGVRAGVSGDDGWPLYLRRYAGLLGGGGRTPGAGRAPRGGCVGGRPHARPGFVRGGLAQGAARRARGGAARAKGGGRPPLGDETRNAGGWAFPGPRKEKPGGFS